MDDLVYELDARRRVGTIAFETGFCEGDIETLGNVTATAVAPSSYLAARGPGSKDRSGRKITSNSISAVIRIAADAGPIAVLTGDLDAVGLEELARTGGAIDAPILVFPHHGGGTGTTDVEGFVNRLVERARPRVVIFSIGRGRMGTPDPAVVRHLRQAAPQAHIICTQLSQHCAKSLPTAAPGHLSSAFALGRRDHACCGGTILVSLRDAGGITPEPAGHLAFIERAAESPLCVDLEPS